MLNYPGCVVGFRGSPVLSLLIPLCRFKLNADLVTAFEARRLPRTFLLLLEGLLNKVPSTRPSCERVSVAIKEGKVRTFTMVVWMIR